MIEFEWEKPDYESGYPSFWVPETTSAPDYEGYWLKLDTWSRDEAILLLHSISPELLGGFNDFDRLIAMMKKPRDLGDSLAFVCSIYDNSVDAKKISLSISPGEFIQWAHSKGFEIPDPLKALLDKKSATKKMPRKRYSKKKPPEDKAFNDEFELLWSRFVWVCKYDAKKLLIYYQKNQKNFKIIEGAWLESKPLFEGIKTNDRKIAHNAKDKVKRKLHKLVKKKQGRKE